MEWRDADRSWPDIKAEWARLTGKPPGGSTLNVRYGRLKASFVELKDGDIIDTQRLPFLQRHTLTGL